MTVLDTTISFAKFQDPEVTAKGEERAWVDLTHMHTLWFNTGSLCNITCEGCYMESSPTNDRLAYITAAEVRTYLDEIRDQNMDVQEIGLTGGEPFMNPDIIEILQDCLAAGYRVLVLSNAMKPLHHKIKDLLALKEHYGSKLGLRISMDHYDVREHESLRGRDTWTPMMTGLRWLSQNGFSIAVAGRTIWQESEEQTRQGYGALFAREGISINVQDPMSLVLFPEMDETVDVPEITTACWGILDVHPDAMMCASSRMVVKRKGADQPSVVPCTLLPYDENFDLGPSLSDASVSVRLNHPHCAKFCVLGGGSCSKAD